MPLKPSAVVDLFSTKSAVFGPKLMHDLGLTDIQAAGLLGNLGHESGGFRYLQEIKPVVKGSRGGWGLAQWTGPRRRAMDAWCKANKLDPASDAANIGYLYVELRGSEKASLAALKREHTLEGATHSFMVHFERPGKPLLASRLVWAKKALPAIRKGLAQPAAPIAPAEASTPPAASVAPAKPKPVADKHAVEPKKPVPVKKRSAPVHHVIQKAKHR